MSLTTGARLTRYSWTVLPLSQDTVDRVHTLAEDKNHDLLLNDPTFEYAHGVPVSDSSSDNNSNFIIPPVDDEGADDDDVIVGTENPISIPNLNTKQTSTTIVSTNILSDLENIVPESIYDNPSTNDVNRQDNDEINENTNETNTEQSETTTSEQERSEEPTQENNHEIISNEKNTKNNVAEERSKDITEEKRSAELIEKERSAAADPTPATREGRRQQMKYNLRNRIREVRDQRFNKKIVNIRNTVKRTKEKKETTLTLYVIYYAK